MNRKGIGHRSSRNRKQRHLHLESSWVYFFCFSTVKTHTHSFQILHLIVRHYYILSWINVHRLRWLGIRNNGRLRWWWLTWTSMWGPKKKRKGKHPYMHGPRYRQRFICLSLELRRIPRWRCHTLFYLSHLNFMLRIYVFEDSLKLSQAVSKSSMVDRKHFECVQIGRWAAKPWWLMMKVGKKRLEPSSDRVCHLWLLV